MLRRLFAVAALVTASVAPAALVASPPAVAATRGPCDNVHPGKRLNTTPWAQDELQLSTLQRITEGRYTVPGRWDGTRLAVGDPVKIAVVDSGFDPRNQVFGSAGFASPILRATKYLRFDCVGHGTAVASIIFAQPNNPTAMVGFAPQAQLIPVQYTNTKGGESAPFALGLKEAIDAGARVINVSSQFDFPSPDVVAQLKRAARLGVVIVAAAGNDDDTNQSKGPFYPAFYSRTMPNIIAVGAVGRDGSVGSFSFRGNYVDVVAPGVAVTVANRGPIREQNFLTEDGTSFAAPFVTATVALLLATHPDMTPAEVKHRLRTTADPPAGSVPDADFGYGTVDPLLAVTSEQDDAVSAPSAPATGSAIAAPVPATPPDRSLQHRALAAAFVLLGLAALTVTGAAVLRGNRRARRA